MHLETCLRAFDELCARNGWHPTLGVVRSEIGKDYLAAAIADGPAGRPGVRRRRARPADRSTDVADAERIVALIGPEPIMDLLARGVDGVLTGRALDIGLFMALPMLRGIPTAIAAHAGKLLECGGLALDPGDSGRAIWASVDDDRLRGPVAVDGGPRHACARWCRTRSTSGRTRRSRRTRAAPSTSARPRTPRPSWASGARARSGTRRRTRC